MDTTRSTTAAPAPEAVAAPAGARQAFLLLRTVFTIAPIAFGLDKFFNLLTDWPGYLAPWVDGLVPGSAQQAMYAVGVIEILRRAAGRAGGHAGVPWWSRRGSRASSSTC